MEGGGTRTDIESKPIPSSEADVLTFYQGRTWDRSPHLQLLAYPLPVRLYVYDRGFERHSQRRAGNRI